MKGFKQVNALNRDILDELFHGDAQIISLKSNYNDDLCNKLKSQILEKLNVGFYENAPNIGRIGMAFFESISSKDRRDFYYKNAQKWNADLFDACFPLASPINSLVNDLNNSWGQANIARFNDVTMFSGLVRIFKEGSSAEPHQDIFLRDAPELFDKIKIKEQIAYNIYLDVSEDGGEVMLWNWKASDEEFSKFQNENPDLAYGMDRKKSLVQI